MQLNKQANKPALIEKVFSKQNQVKVFIENISHQCLSIFTKNISKSCLINGENK